MTTPKKMSPVWLAQRLTVIENQLSRAVADEIRGHIAALGAELNAALADNAALVGELRAVLAVLWGADFERRPAEVAAQRLLSEPHPGAALLEEHRKSLARAKNEGLEAAREAVRAALTTGLLTPGQVRHVMREIDALREPVPCCERETDGDGNCDRHPRSGS